LIDKIAMPMGSCPKCGNNISDRDYFCSKCGARIKEGVPPGVSDSMEETREALSKMGQELEKAFSLAAKDIQEAFKTAGDNVRRSTSKESLICSNCGEKNASDANYCYKCGQKINGK